MLILTVIEFSWWVKSAEEAKVGRRKKQDTQELARMKAVAEEKNGGERGDSRVGSAGGR